VLLGSAEWFAQKRREREDPFEAERRRSQLPPPPESTEADAVVAPENPPLHVEDPVQGSGPRAIGEAPVDPERETFRSA
jgi:hypothetical protein